jgi:hypothetical protein
MVYNLLVSIRINALKLVQVSNVLQLVQCVLLQVYMYIDRRKCEPLCCALHCIMS